MAKNADQKIQELVARFTSDLITVVRESALEAFALSFRAPRAPTPTSAPPDEKPVARRRHRRRRGGVAAKKVVSTIKATPKPTKKAAGKSSKRKRRVTGGKRDPKRLTALTERLAAHVTANAGQTMLEIGKALGASSQDLALPTQKLLTGKQIKRRGERNLTRYFPA